MKKLNLLFIVSKSRIRKDGKAPLFCRLTYLEKRKQFSTGLFINPKNWNNSLQEAGPPNNDNNYINSQLNLIKNQINQVFLYLQINNSEFTVDDFIDQNQEKKREFPKDNLSAFVATMGYSRASYVEYVENEKIETLIACHLNAFNYFGGVVKEALYDNMRTVIIKRNAYGFGKHQLNPMFEDFAKHCGFKIRVCKPYRAKTKGKVERFNHYLRYSFHNSLSVRLSMKRYVMNIDNANSEIIIWDPYFNVKPPNADQNIFTNIKLPTKYLLCEVII